MSQEFNADVERRLANVVRFGTIEEADFGKARYRVRIGNILTDWLPFAGKRSGALKVWSPLTIGEQIVMISASGDLAQGAILGSIESSAHPSPGSDGNTINIEFPDGGTLSYGSTMALDVPLPVKMKAPSFEFEGEVTIKGAVNQSGGDITAETDVIAAAISLVNHTHTGVQSGSSNTGLPV